MAHDALILAPTQEAVAQPEIFKKSKLHFPASHYSSSKVINILNRLKRLSIYESAQLLCAAGGFLEDLSKEFDALPTPPINLKCSAKKTKRATFGTKTAQGGTVLDTTPSVRGKKTIQPSPLKTTRWRETPAHTFLVNVTQRVISHYEISIPSHVRNTFFARGVGASKSIVNIKTKKSGSFEVEVYTRPNKSRSDSFLRRLRPLLEGVQIAENDVLAFSMLEKHPECKGKDAMFFMEVFKAHQQQAKKHLEWVADQVLPTSNNSRSLSSCPPPPPPPPPPSTEVKQPATVPMSSKRVRATLAYADWTTESEEEELLAPVTKRTCRRISGKSLLEGSSTGKKRKQEKEADETFTPCLADKRSLQNSADGSLLKRRTRARPAKAPDAFSPSQFLRTRQKKKQAFDEAPNVMEHNVVNMRGGIFKEPACPSVGSRSRPRKQAHPRSSPLSDTSVPHPDCSDFNGAM